MTNQNPMNILLLMTCAAALFAGPVLGPKVTELKEWQFAKMKPELWSRVALPHSCNAIDGHSASYFRGKTYYRYLISLDSLANGEEVGSKNEVPRFLCIEMAGQRSVVTVNGDTAATHGGGYTPFVVPLKNRLRSGVNEIMIMCDNSENVQLAPVSSDFNKNNGLYGKVRLVEMGDAYFSPMPFGQYRLHVSTPEVSDGEAVAVVEAWIRNDGPKKCKLSVNATLSDREGELCASNGAELNIEPGDSALFSRQLKIKAPHLWNGTADPYLYNVTIRLNAKGGSQLDEAATKVGFRYVSIDPERGFFLNGKPYALRGVSIHQDWNGLATALKEKNFDIDYEMVRELGANFVRLAHYPHNDYAFRKCDELGILVQTEIPWVNVCGERASEWYFENLHSQMREMIANLYNHPSIICWGIWNEVDSWGNSDRYQGRFDPARAVSEAERLYKYAKALDPYRFVGLTDDSDFLREGYTGLSGDYFSENKYCGWYYGKMEDFTSDMEECRSKMKIVNVSEYGCGINPFCHSSDPLSTTQRGSGGARHDEEFGNLLHESYVRQIGKMPYLCFTSLWVMFDFAVADRLEGYMDTADGENFTESEFRKFTNDKGLVTRDRKVKKDVFYLYKSLWNHSVTTVYITSRRFAVRPSGEPVIIKVYSNASSLTLYHNGKKVQALASSGEETGVVWTFDPVTFETASDTFKVVAENGTEDSVTFEEAPQFWKTSKTL